MTFWTHRSLLCLFDIFFVKFNANRNCVMVLVCWQKYSKKQTYLVAVAYFFTIKNITEIFVMLGKCHLVMDKK